MGVEGFNNNGNVILEHDKENKKLNASSVVPTPVLVKGITFSALIKFRPILATTILVKCFLWCKDINAITYIFSFDPLNATAPVEIYNSEKDENMPDLTPFLSQYILSLKKH